MTGSPEICFLLQATYFTFAFAVLKLPTAEHYFHRTAANHETPFDVGVDAAFSGRKRRCIKSLLPSIRLRLCVQKTIRKRNLLVSHNSIGRRRHFDRTLCAMSFSTQGSQALEGRIVSRQRLSSVAMGPKWTTSFFSLCS